MDEAVDRGRRRHRVLEDPAPLAEDEVARDHDAAPLVALREQREEDLGLVRRLLHVAEVVEDDDLVGVVPAQGTGQCEVALGGEELLDDGVRGREAHAVAPLDELVSERGSHVRLADAGQPEAQHVVATLEETSLGQLAYLGEQRFRKAVFPQRRERLARRQIGGAQEPLHAALPTVLRLHLEYLEHHGECGVAPRLDEPADQLAADGRQLELDAQLGQALVLPLLEDRRAHEAPPRSRS